METREILQDIISDFLPDKFTRFFREKNRSFAPRQESFTHYNDECFTDGIKLGEIKFSESEKLVVCSFKASHSLTERTGKKTQYEKGKKILREMQYDAGIFIFYDVQGNFRFSLIYANYLGKRRDWSVFRRFTYFVSKEFTNKTFLQRIGDGDFSNLEKIKDAFSVEKVTKEFYEDIANWYLWTVQQSTFPKDAEVEENGRNIAVIRLITRIVFIWFMREKGLVPKNLFEEKSISAMLEEISPESSTYYQAILQNLFFATLSAKKDERKFRSEIRGYKGYNPDFGNQNVFRFQGLFKNPEKLKDYFGEIPFLNGGLFECLDDKPNGVYIDGFTAVKKNQPEVPNILFFSGETKADLNAAYGTKDKNYKVRGLLDILSSYNFTIDENSPDDQEIALDPELLGRVFENLLASFNPETSTTARKATGSYYTPREIVDYMVTESLKAYFKTHLSGIEYLEKKIDHLFSTGSEENPFNKSESKELVELIESVRIVDPAVGSGAFPMGALNKLVFILNKVDPGNELWKQAQLSVVDTIPDPRIKQDTKNRIEEFFKGKNADYGRKLYLIQKCIYGVDIQQIAVEIAKLRFFISLLVDEKIDKDHPDGNWGIEPLPNLDFKIMQGNSLLEEFEGIKLFDERLLNATFEDNSEKIQNIEKQLSSINSKLMKFYQAKPEWMRNKSIERPSELAALESEQKRLMGNITYEKNKGRVNVKDVIHPSLFVSDKKSESIWKLLTSLHKDFFETAQKKNKDDLKKRIESLEWELIEATFKEQNKISALKKLDQFKKSNTKPFFLWKLHFAEVFKEKGGFDIVIGNPPYIQLQKDGGNLANMYENCGYKSFERTGDIYALFYENGINMLKSGGHLCFITSNKWMRAGYGKSLRKFFNLCNPLLLVDLGPGIFENATVDTNIIIIGKENNQGALAGVTLNAEAKDAVLSDFINKNKNILPKMGEDAWFIGNQAEQNLKEKIERIGKPLKDWDVKIYRGVLTGLNEAFIIDTATRDRLVTDDPKSEEILKPILRGRDIKRYGYEWAGLWIIGTFPVLKLKIDDYPAVKKHLLDFGKDRLEQEGNKLPDGTISRKKTGNKWFETQDPIAYYPEFEKEKVVWKRIGSVLRFGFDIHNMYCQDSTCIMTGTKLKYLCAFMNSRLGYQMLYDKAPKTGTGDVIVSVQALEPLLIPPITPSNKGIAEQIERIVDKIFKNPGTDTTDLEKQIDQMVYKLYDLTPDEISIVENSADKKGGCES